MEPEMQAAIVAMLAAAEESKASSATAATAAQAATTAANAATAAANATTAAMHEVNREQRALRRDFGVLWRKVHGTGSDAPPPPQGDPDRAPSETLGEPSVIDQIEDANEQVSSVSLEMAALEGRMIAALASVERKVMGELTGSKGPDAKPQPLMRAMFGTKQSRQQTAAIIAAIAGIVGLLANAFRAPPPPAPEQRIVVVAPPAGSR